MWMCVGRQVDSACRETQRGRVKQAGSSCIGTSHWGQRFPASSSRSLPLLLSLSFPPQGLRVDRRDLQPHTHIYRYSSSNPTPTHRPQMVVWVSEEIHFKVKYWKGEWSMVILSLEFRLSLVMCVCTCFLGICRMAWLASCLMSDFLTTDQPWTTFLSTW